MRIDLAFIGRARSLAEFYESATKPQFAVNDSHQPLAGLVVPGIGDLLRLRMLPGPDIRTFRCTARLFDFSESAAPVLRIELDMPD